MKTHNNYRLNIKVDELESQEIESFLVEHHQEMHRYSLPESIHALDLNSLKHANITFWSGWLNNNLVASCALKKLSLTHAEIKSMRVSNHYRRQGLSQEFIKFILSEAVKQGYEKLSLETGAMDAFIPARRLYEKFGFIYCSPFSDYKEDIHSVFMTKSL